MRIIFGMICDIVYFNTLQSPLDFVTNYRQEFGISLQLFDFTSLNSFGHSQNRI